MSEPCAEFQARLAAYALGEAALDADAQSHLARCPVCQRAVRDYARVARVLPYDAPDVAPPPGLRERIIAAASQPAVIAPAPATAPRRKPWSAPLWPLLTAALAAIVVLLGWNVSLRSQLDAQSAQIASSREGWQMVIGLLNDPAVHWYAVSGDQARGHVWATPQGDVACLVTQGLPATSSDKVYQVWLQRHDERTSGGVFEARNGNGWILIRPDDPLAHYDSISVTIEPRGGSAAPTGPSVLQGTLASPHASSAPLRRGDLQLALRAVP